MSIKINSVAERIRGRIVKAKKTFRANDNIAEFIEPGELEALQKEVQENFQDVLDSLVIDTANDWNTQETAKRVSKMFIQEIFNGRYVAPPPVTAFPNVSYDELYITGPISIRSTCAHHFQNIVGKCYIGVFPGKNVIGLSKFNRIVDWLASRPQIQEELTNQIANAIQKETKAKGVAVVIRAEHHCMTQRGVKEHESDMTTSVMLGKMRTSEQLKSEFLSLLATMKGMK